MTKWTGWVLAGLILAAVAQPGMAADPAADQIVEKNAAARGGEDAWNRIQTMVWVGHIERANTPSLPFILEMKRPNKSRFEIKGQGQMALRVYDGSHGWKFRPASSGRQELQPYTAEELSFERDGQGLEMPFTNFEAARSAGTLEGTDDIEGRKAYRLAIKMPSGATRHVWVDAETFLVVKYDREARDAFGHSGTVPVYYRGYHAVNGLQMPSAIESGGAPGKPADKMVIDRVVLNVPLDDALFTRPSVPARRRGVSVDAGPSRLARPPMRVAPPLSSGPVGKSPRLMPDIGGMQ